MRKEESFGIVPLKNEEEIWSVFLIQHRRARYWGLPKGHAEKGETPLESACRELKEETGLTCVSFLQEEPFFEEYQFAIEGKPVLKRVYYFVAKVEGEVHLQAEEINDGLWIPLSDAIDKITHPEGKAILSQVLKLCLK